MALEIVGVSKRYGAVVALDDVALRVEPGEVRALYGGNGSGKSTVAKIVAGVVRPDGGEVRLDGRPLPSGDPGASRRAGLAVTFQELSLLPELTVAENLALARTPRRGGVFRSESRLREQAEAVLERVGLAHLASLPVFTLQVGEKYLCELAKALLLAPRYVIFDELTSALHDHEAAHARALLRTHVEGGGGAILVSHRVNEIRQMCDTITVLRNGRRVFEGGMDGVSPEDLVRWVGSSRERASEAAPRRPRGEAARLSIDGLRLAPDGEAISATLDRGEIVGLGGLPDQGQNELLDVLFGAAGRRGRHEIRLDGARLAAGSPTQAVQAGISFVSGDRDAVGFSIRSLRDNLLAAHLNVAGQRPLGDDDLEAALRSLGTAHGGLSLPLNTLSGGNQQKVLLARCFLLKPRLLLAADPTKGIDVAARAEVHAALRAMSDQHGMTVVLTSSDDRELVAVCDRVLVMERHRVVRELSRAEGSLTEEALIDAYMRQEQAA